MGIVAALFILAIAIAFVSSGHGTYNHHARIARNARAHHGPKY